MTAPQFLVVVSNTADALKARRDEVDRLNVFPVPDGDTGTNMSLTMDAVVSDVASLPSDAALQDVCEAVTHGSLMGARGNSGVILSQILRGLCEVVGESDRGTTDVLAAAFERSVEVAFQAVRKPVEGTMLTVLRDSATAARTAADAGLSLEDALQSVAEAAYQSVDRTPELLPVLKENGVVDAGGLGLAVLIDGFTEALTGRRARSVAAIEEAAAPEHIQIVEDWDDEEHLYCTEFLLHGTDLDRDEVLAFVSSMGGSELVVGDQRLLKVHVHTNEPGVVLSHVTGIGEVAEVHINNMRRQQAARDAGLKAAAAEDAATKGTAPTKPIGFVTVAAGTGVQAILESLGADVVVNGGQTMNPSTKDLLEAIESVPAEKVVILPNNKNIIMAASAAASSASKPAVVVPTTSIPQAFAALLSYHGDTGLEELASEMTQAAVRVRSGEVTTAVRDAKGKAGEIKAGQVIGIADHEIEVVGDDITGVALALAALLVRDDAETLTVLAGADLADEDLAALAAQLSAEFPDVEVETHRGEQPVYPVIISAE